MSSSTPLEKRTATLLTVIGVVGTLLSILGIAMPYYLFFSDAPSPLNWCDSCTNVDALIAHARHQTLAIAVIGTMVSFLPRILYGIYVRWRKRQE